MPIRPHQMEVVAKPTSLRVFSPLLAPRQVPGSSDPHACVAARKLAADIVHSAIRDILHRNPEPPHYELITVELLRLAEEMLARSKA